MTNFADHDRPKLLEPGLIPFVPGTERYTARGGGACIISVNAGDKIAITDREGWQPCELIVLQANGSVDFGALGISDGVSKSNISQIINNRGENFQAIENILKSTGTDPVSLASVRFFGENTLSGETLSFTANRPATCIVAAPGNPMLPSDYNTPTNVAVTITRAEVNPDIERPLPTPLADPRLDFRIDRATVETYEVKAGEFIQIMDVAGRQCSDFLAFHLADLERGKEFGLDPTTTRSLMGAAYPGPGLFSKFFDSNMRPLVEVIRDTVGRHDTFALACTAKYYEDMGYPGHANCSTNFNFALSPYGIKKRQGWPAVNFFFNTGIDDNNALGFDEPWSRPGDYVLLRAHTDLVCGSSACPCDIDAANGWNPTDIHVRVYPETNIFSKAIAYRMTPESEPQLTRETAFHPRTSKLTRNFVEYRSFWLPECFPTHGAINEYHACRERAVVMDLSPLRKFEVFGPDAEELLQYTLTRNVRKIAIGQVSYTAMCNETGGMLDDGTIYRLGDNNFRWVCGDEYSGVWLRKKSEELKLKVWIKSSTDQLHNIAIQGPRSREILKNVVWTAPTQPTLEELPWFRFLIGRIGDYDGLPILVSRTGYTGELGYEVWCHPKDALGVWDAIWNAGTPHGLTPLGLEALDMLRIEAGLIFAGYEFDDQIDPFEAGIGFAVALKSKVNEDFIGKEALMRRKAHPSRVLVGLELEGNEVAGNGDNVHTGRSQVGVVTSGTRSPILRKNIALCRMAIEYSELGTQVEVGKIDGHQKRIPATVVQFPFYDPKKLRVRA